MGRTQRKRRQKRGQECSSEDGGDVCFKLMRWLEEQGCALPNSVRCTYFGDTGRGLCATTQLQKDSLLISLPKHIIITIHTVMRSYVGSLFRSAGRSQAFGNQQILAAFLIWEKHLGPYSTWAAYINSLPGKYTIPLTLSKHEKILLPKYLHERVQEQERSLLEAYKQLVAIIRIRGLALCEHCGKSLLADVFRFQKFLWAWNTVNTRAVYFKPTVSTVMLRGENTLALAPFLDLFNHSCFTTTTVEETTDMYKLFTSDDWPPDSQVFISYGPHANYKLYVEYGFVIVNNPNDVVPVTVEEVDLVMNSIYLVGHQTFLRARNELIEQNRLTENLFFSDEGPSFTLQAYIFVKVVHEFDKRTLQQKIFTNEFTNAEKDVINKVVAKILTCKISEYQQQNHKMLQLYPCSESFRVAMVLMNCHLGILEKVYENII